MSWKVDLPNAEIRVSEVVTVPPASKMFRWIVYAEHGANRVMEPVFGAYIDYTRGDIEEFLHWYAPTIGIDGWTFV